MSGIELPPVVLEPAQLIANACVPVLLISYGISLHGQRVLGTVGAPPRHHARDGPQTGGDAGRRVDRRASSCSGCLPHDVLVVVVLAALPTAQNVFNYSQRYGVGETISRDTVFLTTVGCVPMLLLATLLLG